MLVEHSPYTKFSLAPTCIGHSTVTIKKNKKSFTEHLKEDAMQEITYKDYQNRWPILIV